MRSGPGSGTSTARCGGVPVPCPKTSRCTWRERTTLRWPEPAAVALAAGFFLFYYAVYGAAALAADGFTTRSHWYLPGEAAIPLWPWTAYVYLSLNLMLIPMLGTFSTPARLSPLLVTLGAELLVAVACFLVFPLEAAFADPPATGALGLAHSLAMRHNYFPSLHVALAFTGAATLGGRWYYLWASLIALSTLTVHEHHVVDVVGGILLAWAGVLLVYRRLCHSCAA